MEREVSLYRRDFRECMDGSGDSLFDGVLSDLKVPKEKWEDIEEITFQVDLDTVEYDS